MTEISLPRAVVEALRQIHIGDRVEVPPLAIRKAQIGTVVAVNERPATLAVVFPDEPYDQDVPWIFGVNEVRIVQEALSQPAPAP